MSAKSRDTNPLPPAARRARLFLRWLVVAVVVVNFVLWWVASRYSSTERPAPSAQSFAPFQLEPDKAVFGRYGGSKSCRECHAQAYANWERSNHALAERPLDPLLDQASFAPARIVKHGSQTSEVRLAKGRFEFEALGVDGQRRAFPIERVIGVEPLRQCLIPMGGGRYQVTELAVDPARGDWFDVFGDEDRRPGEWGQWTGRGMTWNVMCAACHNTRLRKHYQPATDTYGTSMAEMGVGCEACHGPMADHVQWQRKHGGPAAAGPGANQVLSGLSWRSRASPSPRPSPLGRGGSIVHQMAKAAGFLSCKDGPAYSLSLGERAGVRGKAWSNTESPKTDLHAAGPRSGQAAPLSRKKDPTVRRFTREQWLDICGGCHSRRAELTGDYAPGDDFANHYSLTIPDETDLYYPDGQVREEDYEFASFLGGRMYAAGVRCWDCHEVHSAKVPTTENMLCMRCHNGQYTNAPVVDPLAHSFHKPGGSGDRCVDCHMPLTVYMQRHARRDHGFTIPDPLLTKQHRIPNACGRCHQDKTVEWAMETVDKWYGKRMDRPTRARAQVVAQARAGQTAALTNLLTLARTEPIPLWRAVATGLLKPWCEDPQVTAELIERAGDTNALVRAFAIRALEPLAAQPDTNIQAVFSRRLEDPIRWVRIEAAWALRTRLDTNSVAGRDLLYYLNHNLDMPSAMLQRGVFELDRGGTEAALALFRRAVSWDAGSAPLRHALAIALNLQGKTEEAVRELETACRLAPQDAEMRFKLALALNEAARPREALSALEAAVKLEPNYGSAWYNLGLAYSAQEQPERAVEALVRAESLNPLSARIPYARATILVRLGRIEDARTAAQRALELQPDMTEAMVLVQSLSQKP